ncbi:MAG: precorrin-3B synthase [Nitrospirota bacterium]|nr:precorrin-3B synthase [Nitrospirota bacterium]
MISVPAPQPAAGDKVPAEEQFKTALHPLDSDAEIARLAREGSADLPREWAFRLRWYGLFWEGPRSDTFMVRIKVTGGKLSAGQLAGVCALTERLGLPFLDVTTRQGLQLRGVAARDLPELLDGLAALGLTSMRSGADNIRNLMVCPAAGVGVDELADVLPLANSLQRRLTAGREFADLPRKFNIALCGCGTACIHPELADIAVLAVQHPEGEEIGYTLWVGGQPSTTRVFGHNLSLFLDAGQVPEVCAAILSVFRDHGNRFNRKQARLSHLIESWGLERFAATVEAVLGWSLPRVAGIAAPGHGECDGIGMYLQRQAGRCRVGVALPVGRLSVAQGRALARLSQLHGSGELRLTPRQNLHILHVSAANAAALENALAGFGLRTAASPVRAAITACSGNSYCKLATVETKHRALDIVDYLEQQGLADEPLIMALSACPNTCALHANADIGLQGCKVKTDAGVVEGFHLLVGGGTGPGAAFGHPLFQKVPGEQINPQLAQVIHIWRLQRQPGEGFGAFCRRHTPEQLGAIFTQGETAHA